MNINDRLLENVRKYSTKTAYVFEGTETTYSKFVEKIDKFAIGLKSLGFTKGDHIALVTWNNPYFLIAYYGVLKIGAVIIPINPRYTPNELKRVFQSSDAKAVITADVIFDNLQDVIFDLAEEVCFIYHPSEEPVHKERPYEKRKVYLFSEVMEKNKNRLQNISISPEDPAVMLFTSGTTGAPKGAVLTHKNIYYAAKSHAKFLDINETDRVIVTLPINHVFGMAVTMNGPLFYGATLLLVARFSPRDVFDVAHQYRATIFAGVPTMYNYLLQSDIDETYKKESFSQLRFALSGGASFPITLLKQFEATFNSPVLEGYGLTEAAPVTFNRPGNDRKIGSIGRLVPSMEIKVVDQEGNTLGPGEKGELLIKGPVVMKEYYKSVEQTNEVKQGEWFRSGDVAKIDEDGFVYIVDRSKDVIIVKGHNVYPKEVEEVIYEHPDIVEVSVVGYAFNNIDEEVVAFVVVRNREQLDEETIINFSKQRLTDYKNPSKVVFIDELPKNATGKIDKNTLRKMLKS